MPLAKRFFRMFNIVTLMITGSLCLFVGLARGTIVGFYTEDEEVFEETKKVVLFLACYFLFDGMQGYIQGPIRAMGLQRIASFFAIGCYYGIGIPLALLFAFKVEMGVMGLQAGIAVALLAQFIAYLTILLKQDWQEVADEAIKRIEKEAMELEQLKKETEAGG